ncbi:hypothetical protein [Microbulbifer thermotolerans]|uniref:Uncharacterized protein n=1 Tax=Microbulbifer thermotolerans TaxID=252514 RepID=A0AB35HWM0_MICTH|nr:hypothetical protein [Microbulbifer thermotolerans]MCX2780691.1 hypothetical protein [Microbulbifer thermotolerans]MCX2783583.1 hypothetical protein [Microbulbifer thermotolerans]MCX2795794.1 hypothetical protein [Microbulbifer thermotolerans]MCX2801958.1 hypothetical protein [Microbulbifer thermotolerans]MCX2806321.1 hypothetical protein [Microbulbifer thermotolerans]
MSNVHSAPVNMSESEIRRLRRQLEIEITWLQRQMEEMSGSSSDVDISLRQTYKEMLFCRRALLGRIPR